jgi:hypothetical protein
LLVSHLLALLVTLMMVAVPDGALGGGCQFRLGFAALHDLIPRHVGDCADDETHDPGSGDALQHTTAGLLVWRKAENVTAFTDGYWTWIQGASGPIKRLNAQRFSWEANPERLPIATLPAGAGVLPPVAPGAILPAHRIVAFYGNPLVPAMGALGQGSPDQMLARLQQQATAYAAADPSRPVQPALELIAVVAEGSPGADGTYRLRMPPDLIDQVAQWAARRHDPLILDVQAGRSPVLTEVRALLPYLRRPNVHLALDPEFAMAGDQVPGQVFGSIDATTINQVSQTLADLVTSGRLPPKVLIVHRFREDMLTNYRAIQLDPRVQLVIDMDGVGGPGAKLAAYAAYVHDQPVQYAGVKLFYQQDAPVFTTQ